MSLYNNSPQDFKVKASRHMPMFQNRLGYLWDDRSKIHTTNAHHFFEAMTMTQQIKPFSFKCFISSFYKINNAHMAVGYECSKKKLTGKHHSQKGTAPRAISYDRQTNISFKLRRGEILKMH
jgi:hypothetical protein